VKVQQVGQNWGSLRTGRQRAQAGDRVRITAQLVDTTTGHHLWAERYDRYLKDIFALQDEITVNVMRAMQLKLTEGEQACEWLRHGSSNIEVYEKGMKGMASFRLFSPKWAEIFEMHCFGLVIRATVADHNVRVQWMSKSEASCGPQLAQKLLPR
jgi:adenylate cyclase